MLVRVLTMQVKPDRLADWLDYTRAVGFPGMRAQPGCLGVWRLRRPDSATTYQVVTIWETLADLEVFKASAAMRELSASAVGLTVPPHAEDLYDVIAD